MERFREPARRCKQYIDSLDQSTLRGNPGAIADAIDKFSETSQLMTIGPAKSAWITNELKKKNPQYGLEFGTFIGYLALRLAPLFSEAYYCLELDDEYIKVTTEFLDLAGIKNVKILNGKSSDSLLKVKDELATSKLIDFLDFVLFDHDKKLYVADLRVVETYNLIAPGSLVVADNIIRPGVPGYTDYVRGSPQHKQSFNQVNSNPNGPKFVGRWNILYDSKGVEFGEDAIEVSTFKLYLDG